MIAGLSDIVYMQTEKGKLFVHSPNTLQENHIDKLDTSSCEFQSKEAGNVDAYFSAEDIFLHLRKLITFLPSNNEDRRMNPRTDDANRFVQFNEKADVLDFIKELADNFEFMELKSDYAPEMVTGLIRLNGQTVAVVANRANEKESGLSANGCYKVGRFIRFCDCFNIPVLTLANSKGFNRTIKEETKILRAAANLTSSYAMATVPKITLITGQLYGTVYNILGSKGIGTDLVLGFEQSEIGVMDAGKAAKIIYPDANNDELKAKTAEYEKMQQGARAAAARGLIDTVIEESYSRRYLIGAFDMLMTKREFSPVKKHSTL